MHLRSRNNMVMVKLATPKRVQLPNGRTFYATYRRTIKDELPNNVTIKKTCRKRVRQQRRRIGKVFQFVKKN